MKKKHILDDLQKEHEFHRKLLVNSNGKLKGYDLGRKIGFIEGIKQARLIASKFK